VRITRKQAEILSLVCLGNRAEGHELVSWIDMDQLVNRLSYEASKQAIQCSIRVMEKRGLVARGDQELREHRLRRVVRPTTLGVEMNQRQLTPGG